MFKPTDEQWWAMCDACMSLPTALHEADLTQPFVYDRQWGVFMVPSGYHQQAMALLLAFRHGLRRTVDVTRHLGLKDTEAAAEVWLAQPGTAFRSSVGRQASGGHAGNLNGYEQQRLGAVMWLLES